MSDTRVPTPEQAAAIRTVGRDLCVTAGAGSGKTFTLVRRFHELVVSGTAPVGGILAITFTEKAAAQMKERIADLFEEEGRERERREIEGAAISTIHALCARILRENAIEAGLDPRFSVLEEVEADQLRREALAEATTSWREDRPDDLRALGIVKAFRLVEEVLDLHERVRAAGVDPRTLDPGEPASAGEAREALFAAGVDLEAAATGVTLPEKSRQRIDSVLAALADLTAAGDDEAAWRACLRARESAKGRVAKVANPAFSDVKASLPALVAALADRIANAAVEALGALVGEVEERFRRRKAEAGYVDFADLELRALDLLRERPDVAERLREQHPHLLVDEMQDVSRVQAGLLAALRPPDGCFCVGDVKQSIYGFRHADVDVLLDESRDVGEDGRLALTGTFRCRPEILAAVESVFRPVWREGEGRIVLEDLRAEGSFLPIDQPCVEILLADGTTVGPARRREAALVADRIVSFVERETLTLTRGGEERPARFRDVAILLRATRDVKVCERALLDRDVPYRVVGGRGFWEAREIVDLANLLRVVAGPGDDEIALASTLRSPVVGLGDEALVRVFDRPREERTGAVPREVPGLSAEESQRLASFADLLVRLRAMRGRAPLARIVDEALTGSGLPERVVLQRNGRQRLANLRKVRTLARDLDRKGLFSLSEFVDLIDERRDLTIREAEAPPGQDDEDAVSLMTIHAAKGLEFPVVFVVDLDRKPPPDSGCFPWGAGRRLGVRVQDGESGVWTPVAAELRSDRDRREREESHRLLYVAMTRAAEHLVLSAGLKPARSRSVWLDTILGGLGLDVDGIPAGETMAGSEDAPVRVVRSPETRGGSTGLRPPLVRTHRRALEAGSSLDLEPGESDEAEVEALVAAAAAERPPESFADYVVTVSEVLAWARDPEEHRLRYRIGLRDWSPVEATGEDHRPAGGEDESFGRDPAAAARGRAAHRLLETARAGETDDRLLEMASTFLKEEDPTIEVQAPELADWFRRFHGGEIGKLLQQSPRVRREASFLWRLPWGVGGGMLLRGTMDLLFETSLYGDCLVDFKAGRIGEDGHRQMRLYALALEAITGRLPERAVLWSLRDGKPHLVDLDEARLDEERDLLRRFVSAMGEGGR